MALEHAIEDHAHDRFVHLHRRHGHVGWVPPGAELDRQGMGTLADVKADGQTGLFSGCPEWLPGVIENGCLRLEEAENRAPMAERGDAMELLGSGRRLVGR